MFYPPPNPKPELEDLRKMSVSIKTVIGAVFGGQAPVVLGQQAAPTPSEGQAVLWVASGSGTLDGQAYAQGDLLFTGNVGGTQKTVLIIDWSAF